MVIAPAHHRRIQAGILSWGQDMDQQQSIFIYVIGVKLFSDKENKVTFKKVLIGVGYAHTPGILRFFAITPDFVIPIIF